MDKVCAFLQTRSDALSTAHACPASAASCSPYREAIDARIAGSAGASAGRARPNDFRTLFDELCAEAGFTPRIAIETSDPSVGITLANAGLGAMLTLFLALRSNPTIKSVPASGIPAARTIATATIRGRRHPALTALSDAIATAAHSLTTSS